MNIDGDIGRSITSEQVDWNDGKWSSIYDLNFRYGTVKKQNSLGEDRSVASFVEVENILTLDIESSNGFRFPDGKYYGFSHELYRINPKLYEEAEKSSLMYVWQCAVEQDLVAPLNHKTCKVFMGRTYKELADFLHKMTDMVLYRRIYGDGEVDEELFIRRASSFRKFRGKRPLLTIYVHNLGYEFQHFRNAFNKRFSLSGSVFARQERRPIQVRFKPYSWSGPIILKDTLCLVQKSLKQWGIDDGWPVQKKDEHKDFYLPILTPTTPLTRERIEYSINDVVSMIYGIRKYREKYRLLGYIPLTQTGQVRAVCDSRITEVNSEWANICRELDDVSLEQYKDFRRLFMGGSTHANRLYTNKLLKGLRCYDFASSYPAVMASMKFPISNFTLSSYLEFKEHRSGYFYYLKAKIKGFSCRTFNVYFPSSKAISIDTDSMILDNGKVVYTDEIEICVTDQDWDTIVETYKWDTLDVYYVARAKADYLPVEMVETILNYYSDKTELKGTGKESLYNESKQFINSIYGACVTRIINDDIEFNDGWEKFELDSELYDKKVQSMAKKSRCFAYQIGVWVTAHARRNLWKAIIRFDKFVVYYDTDSLKGFFDEEAVKWIQEYNESIKERSNSAAKALNIDPSRYCPKTVDGSPKPLGYFAEEDYACEFKTLGAKRYAYEIEKNGKAVVKTVIAGLPKSASKSLIKHVSDMSEDMVFGTEVSGKLMASYNDCQKPGLWVDYRGDCYYSDDKYGICLMPTTFAMGDMSDYLLLCSAIQECNDYFDDSKILRDL